MKPPAFQFYPDSFLGGTALLTCEETGAYIRLLCYQWDLGSLPNNDTQLANLARCDGNAVASIRHKFTLCPDGKLRNDRMELERQKQAEYRAKQAGNAAKRWVGNAKPHAVAMPTDMPNVCSPSPSPSPISIPKPAAPVGAEIEAIYQAYPRKVGKAGALKAITNLLKRNPPAFAAELLAKVQAYAEAVKTWPAGDERFIPHPATWFNDARYDDDPATWTRKGAPIIKTDRSQFQHDDYSKFQSQV